MGIIIDLVLVAFVLINVFIGYKKGLIKVIIDIIAFFAAIILTLVLFKPISKLVIENTEIDDNIKSAIIENVTNQKNEDNGEKNNLRSFIEEKINDEKNTTVDVLANSISIKATEVITAIALFIVFRVVLILLRLFSDALSELPFIKQFNETGGILYGLLKSVIIIYIILTILYFVNSVNSNEGISKAINETYITKVLYENNILINYCLSGKNLL